MLGSAEVDRGTCQRDGLVRVTVGTAHYRSAARRAGLNPGRATAGKAR